MQAYAQKIHHSVPRSPVPVANVAPVLSGAAMPLDALHHRQVPVTAQSRQADVPAGVIQPCRGNAGSGR